MQNCAKIQPIVGTASTHWCRRYKAHEDAHRCSCGYEWEEKKEV
jgi:hypothetical protein